MPEARVFQESRMREICMSGSTRGEWVAVQRRPLSYSTGAEAVTGNGAILSLDVRP